MAFYDDYVFDESYDTTRFCYARARLLREAEKSEGVVDAVMTCLQAPITSAARRRLSVKEKLAELKEHIVHISRLKTSPWKGSKPPEIFAAGMFLVEGFCRGET